jgi:hypothetical protein
MLAGMSTSSTSNTIPRYAYILCTFAGALIGFMLPGTSIPWTTHAGILDSVIAFELNYLNLLSTIGAIWLIYLLSKRRFRGRQVLVIYGGLGLVGARLIVAAWFYFRK